MSRRYVNQFGHQDPVNEVFVASGKNIQQRGEMRGASVYHVAPTILYLAGLPVSRNMRERPLLGIVDDRFKEANPVQYIGSFDEVKVDPDSPKESSLDAELMNRFRELGYIE